MKKIFLIFITVFTFCAANAQQSIIGNWKVIAIEKDNEKVPMEETALRKYIYQKALEEKGKDSVLNAEDSSGIEMSIEMMTRGFGNMKLNFGKDKKLTISYGKKIDIETYSYNPSTKTLTTINKKKKEKKFLIQLQNNTLLLDNKEGDAMKMYLERIV